MTEHNATRLLTSVWAVASLGFGLAAVVFFENVGGLLAIVAVVTGHVARHEIRVGFKAGNGPATAGLALGYCMLALSLLVIVMRSIAQS
jgi:hypothetical protein